MTAESVISFNNLSKEGIIECAVCVKGAQPTVVICIYRPTKPDTTRQIIY